MPRTILDQRNAKHRELKVLINGTAAVEKKSMEELGRAIGVSGRTAYRYLDKPESLPLDKLLKLGRNLNISISDLRECIKY